ncbi:MAG: DUF3570 domain-containing protein [Proteobacteria bacterium]|nr:DUF3570 domain-containing protein [Pseudomonadota bacterium]
MDVTRPSVRKALAALLALSCVFSIVGVDTREAQAEEYALAQSYVHAFSNNVAVFTELFALNKEFSLDTSAYLKYTVDIIQPGLFGEDDDGDAISSASSAAAGGGQDTRHELTAGVSHNFKDLFKAELYYDTSSEKDYSSSTPTVTLSKEFFNKNTTLSFGFSKNMDEISGKFLGRTEKRNTSNYYLGVTQVISPVTIVQAGYSHSDSKGYMPEGIRLVPVDGATAASCTEESATCMDEAFPDNRKRNAFILGINHYFKKETDTTVADKALGISDGSTIRLTFRYYYDDWDIDAFTAEVVQSRPLSENRTLRLNYRAYIQDKASFFKDDYLSSDTLRSTSPQHRSFHTHLLGAKLIHQLKSRPQAGPFELGTLEGKYEFYLESSRVSAHILMASLKFVF